MLENVMQAYMEIEQAMERYSLLLEEHVASLQKSEDPQDQAKFERMKSGASAMRDSCGIFLSYAKFVAYGMPDSDDLNEDEDLQT